ncbi:hypothetical protein E4U19_003018 [Claviceps sp. Clav32 group G5]|nr:hypothetical protein E4U19_003018 [Claviceps sp. Clav32 group G5]
MTPTILLVHFDSYAGPPVEELVEDTTLATYIAQHFGPDEQARLRLNKNVPIFRSRRDFIYRHSACTRTQFPLTVAYAITVHKPQGCTLDEAVADISGKDFSPGLTYVAVFVRSLDGIIFDCPFDLQNITTRLSANRLADLATRKKDQDVMNLPMRTGMDKEATNHGIDNDEEHVDASSEGNIR